MSGRVVRQARKEDHRCYPPDCHEWPAGEWKIDRGGNWEYGDLWVCDCGHAWRVGGGPSQGLWKNWVRSRRDDETPPADAIPEGEVSFHSGPPRPLPPPRPDLPRPSMSEWLRKLVKR